MPTAAIRSSILPIVQVDKCTNITLCIHIVIIAYWCVCIRTMHIIVLHHTHRQKANQAMPILYHRFKDSKPFLYSVSTHCVPLGTHLPFTDKLVPPWWYSLITGIILAKILLHSWHYVNHITVLCLVFHKYVHHNYFRLWCHLLGVFVKNVLWNSFRQWWQVINELYQNSTDKND